MEGVFDMYDHLLLYKIKVVLLRAKSSLKQLRSNCDWFPALTLWYIFLQEFESTINRVVSRTKKIHLNNIERLFGDGNNDGDDHSDI